MGDLKTRLQHARSKVPRLLIRSFSAKEGTVLTSRHHARHPAPPKQPRQPPNDHELSPQPDHVDPGQPQINGRETHHSPPEEVDNAQNSRRSSSNEGTTPESLSSSVAGSSVTAQRAESLLGSRGDLHDLVKKASSLIDEPIVTIEQASPDSETHEPPGRETVPSSLLPPANILPPSSPTKIIVAAAHIDADQPDLEQPSPLPSDHPPTNRGRPALNSFRRQSLVSQGNARFIKTLLEADNTRPNTSSGQTDYFATPHHPPTLSAAMLHRKIWVRRSGASPTMVTVRENDLVDDVRDEVLKKYGNSLGRSFDAPDVAIHIVPRDHNQKTPERVLGPDEDICRTLDAYYPGGQTMEDALLIDVPQKRTPKPSPRSIHHHHVPYFAEDTRPLENGTDYFPPMPIVNAHSPGPAHTERSMTVLTTGQLPPLPSPGGTRRHHHSRPKYGRHNTGSPTANVIPTSATSSTILANRQASRPRLDSSSSEPRHIAPQPPPLPTPPAPEAPPTNQKAAASPGPALVSPRPVGEGKKRRRKQVAESPSLPSGLLDGTVPPINCLIVEDNSINMKLLEAFMKRLKVRWSTAVNGADAVTKWRQGGFHLVLMDIQLPIMSGLEATREIRRLERVNNIGVFSSSSAASSPPEVQVEEKEESGEEAEERKRKKAEEDTLGDASQFKSPVIIVALTASSLQSDRHEALGAGCNDFLTKPVNFVWLERKVKEWGCMQALIDFDGWRKWKDFTKTTETNDAKDKPPGRIHKRSGSYVPVSHVKKNAALASTDILDKAADGNAQEVTAA